MTIEDVKEGVKSYFIHYDYVLWNSYVFQWECDFFGISKTDYMTECEIKMSKSDFAADFKKSRKHLVLGHPKELFVIPGETNNWDVPYSYLEICDKKFHSPNRFMYVCPEGLIDVQDIPKYAGLLYVIKRDEDIFPTYRLVKKPPFIHKFKRKPGFLADKFFWKNKNQDFEIKQLKHRIERLSAYIREPEKFVNKQFIETLMA